jgi:hypothetical protein
MKRRKILLSRPRLLKKKNYDENQNIDSDEEMALIVKGLRRIMKKKKFGKMG